MLMHCAPNLHSRSDTIFVANAVFEVCIIQVLDIARKGLGHFAARQPSTKAIICIRCFHNICAVGNTSSMSPAILDRTNKRSPFGFSLSVTTDKNDLDVNNHI
jgi:hypothetical protein